MRRTILLVLGALTFGGCAQDVWQADGSRYPTKKQQEAAFERHSKRCELKSRVIRTPSTTLNDTQAYRQGHRIEHDRRLYNDCMEAAGFRLARPDLERTPPAPMQPVKRTEYLAKEKDVAKEKVPEKEKSDATEPSAAEAPAPLPTPSQEPRATSAEPAPVVDESQPVQPKTTSIAATNSPYRVQLAAFRARAAAENEWARLQATLPDVFGSKEPIIEKKSLPGRGDFYRLQTGGFDTLHEARSMCARLRAKKQACFALRSS